MAYADLVAKLSVRRGALPFNVITKLDTDGGIFYQHVRTVFRT
jgi:hypothetical protein